MKLIHQKHIQTKAFVSENISRKHWFKTKVCKSLQGYRNKQNLTRKQNPWKRKWKCSLKYIILYNADRNNKRQKYNSSGLNKNTICPIMFFATVKKEGSKKFGPKAKHLNFKATVTHFCDGLHNFCHCCKRVYCVKFCFL